MEYTIAKPSLLLSRYIKLYWAIENCIPDTVHSQRIVPNGLMELTFYSGDRPKSSDASKSITENTIITGHLQEFYDLTVSGKLSMFSIQFNPYGLSSFFDIPLTELYNHTVPLIYLLGSGAAELEANVYEAHSFAEKIKIVEHFLFGLLAKQFSKNDFDRIEHSVARINQTRGLISIDNLASEACFSRKQFERIFSQYVGTSPKRLLKTIRFQNSISEWSKKATTNLTELSYKCGYYDQSHMTNDFQKLTGMSPKQYFGTCDAYSDYFQ